MTDSLVPQSGADSIPTPPSTPVEPPSIASTELFQGARVVVITHAGENYRLLVTRNNRLILQK